jgi:trans-2,3-dihydro-3-hydroxyanthranilate isomerase
MPRLKYYIVDVFAEKKYQGNQLAVFMETSGLSSGEMQAIALETNFAETTFIGSTAKRNGGYDVRIFTPDTEVPFAGHPTLGTAYIIAKYIDPSADVISMNYPVGRIPVDVIRNGKETELLWMKQINPEFGETMEKELAASILGLETDDLFDQFPVVEVSTGLPFFIVPLKDLHSLKNIKVDISKYYAYMDSRKENIITPAFLSFSPDTYESGHDLSCRMHYLENGQLVEDAATGSANGCLLSWLLKYNYLQTDEINIEVEQGYEIRRPSLIYHKGKKIDEKNYEIHIGGRVVEVSEGSWNH